MDLSTVSEFVTSWQHKKIEKSTQQLTDKYATLSTKVRSVSLRVTENGCVLPSIVSAKQLRPRKRFQARLHTFSCRAFNTPPRRRKKNHRGRGADSRGDAKTADQVHRADVVFPRRFGSGKCREDRVTCRRVGTCGGHHLNFPDYVGRKPSSSSTAPLLARQFKKTRRAQSVG